MKIKEILEHFPGSLTKSAFENDLMSREILSKGAFLYTIPINNIEYETYMLGTTTVNIAFFKNKEMVCVSTLLQINENIWQLDSIEKKYPKDKNGLSTRMIEIILDSKIQIISDDTMSQDGEDFFLKLIIKFNGKIYDLKTGNIYPLDMIGQYTGDHPSVKILDPKDDIPQSKNIIPRWYWIISK